VKVGFGLFRLHSSLNNCVGIKAETRSCGQLATEHHSRLYWGYNKHAQFLLTSTNHIQQHVCIDTNPYLGSHMVAVRDAWSEIIEYSPAMSIVYGNWCCPCHYLIRVGISNLETAETTCHPSVICFIDVVMLMLLKVLRPYSMWSTALILTLISIIDLTCNSRVEYDCPNVLMARHSNSHSDWTWQLLGGLLMITNLPFSLR